MKKLVKTNVHCVRLSLKDEAVIRLLMHGWGVNKSEVIRAALTFFYRQSEAAKYNKGKVKCELE